MITAHLVETIDIANVLGECVLWRASDKTVWWTDIQAQKLYRLDWRTKQIQTYNTPERLGSFGFVEGRDDLLIAAFESGFALFAPESAAVHWLARPDALGDGVRLNDGRVDRFGRFWAGAMIEHALRDDETPNAFLYMLDAEGDAHIRARGVHISNGLCWNPTGDRIYLADSMRNKIFSAACDGSSNNELSLQDFAKTSDGSPDGAIVDGDGRYWSALWGGARVACYSPAGKEIFSLSIDAPQPTCPAFGGENGDFLFVTSARDGLSDEALAASPSSGSLFVFETNVSGAPSARAKVAPAVMAASGFTA